MKTSLALLERLERLHARAATVAAVDDASVVAAELRAVGVQAASGRTQDGKPIVYVSADDEAAPALAEARDAKVAELFARGLSHVFVVLIDVFRGESPPSEISQGGVAAHPPETLNPTESR